MAGKTPKTVKTLPMPQKLPQRDAGMPTGIWDPIWEKPEVASKIAAKIYADLRHEGAKFTEELVPDSKLPELPERKVEERTFKFLAPTKFETTSTKVKGGSYGEIYRKVTFGNMKPAVNFHAQAATFGLDSTGRFFLRGEVGRVGGDWQNRAWLVLRFLGPKGKVIGGISWHGELDPPANYDVRVQFSVTDRADAYPRS